MNTTEIQQKASWRVNTTQTINENRESVKAITGRGADALNFDHISQSRWESDQKGGIVLKKKKDNSSKMELLC